MNQNSPLTLTERTLYKKITMFFFLSCFVLITAYIGAFAPLYIYFANDILYMGTLLPELFSILSSAIDILVFAVVYGTSIYVIYRFTARRIVRLPVIYGALILYKNIGNLIVTYITDGLPSKSILPDLLNIGIYILLECLQYAVVLLIAGTILTNARRREEIRKDAAMRAKKTYTPKTESFPFSKVLSFKNPIQKALFWVAFVPMAVRVASRIWYDIWFFIQYGLYDGLMDILWMILYYSMDILSYGVLVYFLIMLLLLQLQKADAKHVSLCEKAEETIL